MLELPLKQVVDLAILSSAILRVHSNVQGKLAAAARNLKLKNPADPPLSLTDLFGSF